MKGSCKCGIKFELLVFEIPRKDEPVKVKGSWTGEFQLIQEIQTTRALTGQSRLEIMKRLENEKAAKLYYDNVNKTPMIRLLHGNSLEKSMQALRKIKSNDKISQ